MEQHSLLVLNVPINTNQVTTKGALHELNQMVNLRISHLVKCRRVARDANPRLKLT